MKIRKAYPSKIYLVILITNLGEYFSNDVDDKFGTRKEAKEAIAKRLESEPSLKYRIALFQEKR